MKLKLVTAFILCSFGMQIKPLSENSAQWGALSAGATVGTITGALMYYFVLHGSKTMTVTKKITITGATALISGFLAWNKLNQFLNSMTPTGRFSAAHKIISLALMDSLIARNFNTESEFINHINARFGTRWPLVRGQKHLILMRDNLLNAINILTLSFNESENKSKYNDLPQRCLARQEKTYAALSIIEDRLDFIKTCKNYSFQVAIHENHLEKEHES